MEREICESKMGHAGVVKNIICHHLENEAELLRSGPRRCGGGQATDDQIDTLAKGWKMGDKGLTVVKVISKLYK